MDRLPLEVDTAQDTVHPADNLFVGMAAEQHQVLVDREVAYNLVAVGDQSYSCVAAQDSEAGCVPEVYPAGSATSINKNIVGNKTKCDLQE